MQNTTFYRFLGGSPLAVVVRLAVISVVVGALMSWFDIEPLRILFFIERSAAELWETGFDGLRQLGRYLVAGAALVVPIWLLTRLFSVGELRRPHDGPWRLPGAPPAGPERQREDVRSNF